MRTDPKKPYEFYDLAQWGEADLGMDVFRPTDPEDPNSKLKARSFSGNERNRLFMQRDDNFVDATLVSGADFPKDSRNFSLLDFDRDGFVDMAVTSPMSPRLQIFRNTLADRQTSNAAFITLQGGRTNASRDDKGWSSRDGIGAKLIVRTGETSRAFLRSCGEGLASQNSRWIHVGLGEFDRIDEVEVQWPSGKITKHQNIQAGARVVLHENGETKVD